QEHKYVIIYYHTFSEPMEYDQSDGRLWLTKTQIHKLLILSNRFLSYPYGKHCFEDYMDRYDCLKKCGNYTGFNDYQGRGLRSKRDFFCNYEKCPRSCYHEFYDREMLDSKEVNETLVLEQSTDHFYQKYTEQPAMLLIDYLLYISSSLGFWVGMDAMVVVIFVLKLIRNGRFKKISRYLSIAGASSVAIYHLIFTIQCYLEYPTLTRSVIAGTKQITLEEISICFEYLNIDPSREKSFYQNLLKSLVNISAFDEQELQLNNYPIDTESIALFFHTDHKYLCYRISVNFKKIPTILLLQYSTLNRILSVQFYEIEKYSAYILLHSTNSYPRKKIRKRENIYSYDHYHEVFLSHTNRLTLLKHPYRFNCIDYKESQLACLENCANRSYQHFHHLDLNTIGKILTANETTYCSHACAKPDCKSLNYRIEWVGWIKNKDNSTSIDILANLHETSIQYLPAFSLPELILYLLGVVGLWSGLSLLDLPKIFMMFIDKCKEINLYRKQTIVRKISSYDTD
ncbi:MAG TPA: hypothetical protein VHZ50_07215, partial [Puia sp.]|nr:hypothetical protein [Puia sp.]